MYVTSSRRGGRERNWDKENMPCEVDDVPESSGNVKWQFI
jgi:hypothetical protein